MAYYLDLVGHNHLLAIRALALFCLLTFSREWQNEV